MEFSYTKFSAHGFEANCYLLRADGHAVVIDPSEKAADIVRALKEDNLTLDAILLTHGHFDHILALDDLRDATGAPAYIHEDDAQLPSDSEKNAYAVFFGKDRVWRSCEHTFREGTVLPFLGGIRVYHTPGHTAGSVCFLAGSGRDRCLYTGDTLFEAGIGRCDLYSGDRGSMGKSLARLETLDPDLPIAPGHGSAGLLGQALDTAHYM